jgi:NAD(P)-dependent dehydrogenase (short-subunit alcohol dehydrogenase family)
LVDSPMVLVTGASSGIGKASASQLAASGFRVFGCARSAPVEGALFPLLFMDVRDERSVNVGSIGGLMGMPFQSAYSASKYGIEGYSESLQMEVRSFGVRVVLLDPGDVHTEITPASCAAGKWIASPELLSESFGRDPRVFDTRPDRSWKGSPRWPAA